MHYWKRVRCDNSQIMCNSHSELTGSQLVCYTGKWTTRSYSNLRIAKSQTN